MLPALMMLILIAIAAVDIPLRKSLKVWFKGIQPAPEDKKHPSERKIFVLKWFVLPALVVVQAVLVFVPLTVFNQSVVAWRVFHANIEIVRPYVSSRELFKITSSFAAMTSEQEYLLIDAKLHEIAKSNERE